MTGGVIVWVAFGVFANVATSVNFERERSVWVNTVRETNIIDPSDDYSVCYNSMNTGRN